MSIKTTTSGPVVTLECTDVLTEGDLDTLFKAFAVAARVGPFVVITDTTKMKTAPAAVITAFSSRLKTMPAISRAWLGDAVVIRSAAVRFIVSTLLVIAPMPTEVKVVEHLSEARSWCARLLRGAGVGMPAELLKSA